MGQITPALANTLCDAVVDSFDVGSGDNAVLRIFDDSAAMPEALATSDSAVLLVELDFADPAYGDAGAGELDDGVAAIASAFTPVNGAATGTATYFRICDTDGNAVYQHDGIDTSAGEGIELVLNSLTIAEGVPVDITSLDVRVPESI